MRSPGFLPDHRGSTWLPFLLLPLLVAALFDPVFAETLDIDGIWEVFCLSVTLAGIALRAFVAGSARAGHPETTGAYSVLRHPEALGSVLVWTGLSLFPRSWPALLVALGVLAIAYGRRTSEQDDALRRQFGDAFESWAARTPSFIPALRRWQPATRPFSWRTAVKQESTTLVMAVGAFFLLEVLGDLVVGEPVTLEPEWLALFVLSTVPWLAGCLLWATPAAAASTVPATDGVDRPIAWLAVAAACLLAWDASPADLLLARLAGGPHGFALRDSFWTSLVLHDGLRATAWVAVAWLAVSLRWPTGVLRGLLARERAWLLATVLGSMVVVSVLKHWSATSCPWDLQAFGGPATYVSHWHWGLADGGPGHCFPAGHASAGFAFMAGFFVLRRAQPAAGAGWLAIAVVAGTVMGLAQEARGAHFASHTLWTAWICWACSWFSAVAFLRLPDRP